MDNESVKALAALLKSEPSVIEKSLEEGGLNSVISKYQESVNIFSDDELDKKLKNHAEDTIANLGKDGDLPQHIYSQALGNGLEKKEKALAKQHGIVEWNGLDNLVELIAQKEVSESGKATGEKDSIIAELKQLVKDNDKNHEEALAKQVKDFDNEIIRIAVKDGVSLVPIDGDNETKIANQSEMLKTMFVSNHVIERKDGKLFVYDKAGNLIKDKVGDPVPLSDVIQAYAPEWVDVKSVPEGGRGASSTEKGNHGVPKFATDAEREAYIEEKEMNPYGADALQFRQDNPVGVQ